MQGILLVDKPAGWTSHDVVNYVRKIVAHHEGKKPKNTKVGHTGTLDPFATGLLVLLIGKDYTRKAASLARLDKTYEVTMQLGQVSTTGDPEGQVTPYVSSAVISTNVRDPIQSLQTPARSLADARDDNMPSKEAIKKVLRRFTGQIQQTPPVYSAIKINGQRAYKLARAGQTVALEPRRVMINDLRLTNYSCPEVKLLADVSSGTYIRVLVEDIAQALGTGAYTSALRRTTVGKYSLDGAIPVQNLTVEQIKAHLQS